MGSARGQALIVALGAVFVVMLGAGVLAALGGALAQKGRLRTSLRYRPRGRCGTTSSDCSSRR